MNAVHLFLIQMDAEKIIGGDAIDGLTLLEWERGKAFLVVLVDHQKAQRARFFDV